MVMNASLITNLRDRGTSRLKIDAWEKTTPFQDNLICGGPRYAGEFPLFPIAAVRLGALRSHAELRTRPSSSSDRSAKFCRAVVRNHSSSARGFCRRRRHGVNRELFLSWDIGAD